MLQHANIEVKPSKELEAVIAEKIKETIKEQVYHQVLLVDTEKLVELTSMSKRFLEEHILEDPRVKQHQRRRSRKKFYLYKPTMRAIEQIVEEWKI